MCSVCGQLSGCCSGGMDSGCVRQCISAQVRLYNLGTVEFHVGSSSFIVSGKLTGATFFFWWAGRVQHCGSRIAKLEGVGTRSVRT